MNADPEWHKWTGAYPEIGTGTIPAAPYYDPDFYDREIEKVFKKSWLFAGSLSELQKPGDFFVRELQFAKTSVIVVRGQDGTIRAFHNICTHRGNKLEWRRSGNARGFACRYHGWAFDTKGNLVRAVDESNYWAFDKQQRGLPPVHVDVWQQFVFINLEPRPAQTLEEYLGEWGKSMAGYPFADMPCFTRYTAELNANWKAAMDGSLETLHFGFVHKSTAAPVFSTAEQPLGKMHAAQIIGRHARLSTPGINPDYVPSKVALAAARLIGREESERDVGRRIAFKDAGPGVNPAKTDDWVTDMNMIFPNLSIQIFGALYLLYIGWPIGPNRSIFELRYYYPRPTNASQAFGVEVQTCDFRDIFLEDLSINEKTQSALESGVLPELVLHDRELLIRHRQQQLAALTAY